jgi:hypothetical protein
MKRLLLFIWAAWLSIVSCTNALDGAKSLGLLPESWAFASGNYGFMAETTRRLAAPDWLNAVLFAGVVCWEVVAAVLFWRALWCNRTGGATARRCTRTAFTVSLALWGAFLLADEIFIAYSVEGTHLRIFAAQLVTLLIMELVPERRNEAPCGVISCYWWRLYSPTDEN